MSMISSLRRRYRVARLSSSLNIKTAARYDASQTPALPREEALSETERSILARHAQVVEHTLNRRDLALNSERLKTIETELAEDEKSFTDLVRETKAALGRYLLDNQPEWSAALLKVAKAEREHASFKRDNLLERDCRETSALAGGFIMFLWSCFEGIGTGYLFAGLSPWGWSGGWLLALLLSLPLVILAVFTGYFGLRLRNHVNPHIRALGSLVITLLGSATLAWIFYVGHLRVLAERTTAAATPSPFPILRIQNSNSPEFTPDPTYDGVLSQILTDPLAPFNNPSAANLMMFSLAVVVFAVFHGYHGIADEYPGYTCVAARLRVTKAEHDALRRTLTRGIRRITVNATATIKRRYAGAQKRHREALGILARAHATVIRFNQALAEEHAIHRQVLETYQALNRRHRGEESVPARFNQPVPEFSPEPPPFPDWETTRTRLAELVAHHLLARDEAIAELEAFELQLIAKLQSEPAEDPAANLVALIPNLGAT